MKPRAAGRPSVEPNTRHVPGGRSVSSSRDPQIEIEAVCTVHHGSGRLVVRREGNRIVLDGRAGECCVITLEGAAVTGLFDVLGEWLG